MITTLFPYPKQYLHTVLQNQTLLRGGLGFRGVGELLPCTAGIFVFVYKMLRFRILGVLNKAFLAAPACCTVFTAFSYYPTTCGLAVSLPSSLQLQLLSQFWGLSLCNFTAMTFKASEPLQLLQLSQVGSLSPCMFCSFRSQGA